MAALPPAVAAVRTAVRTALRAAASDVPPERSTPPLAVVACSGGPDSLALAACSAFVAPRVGWRAGLVTVDHGLQPGSREQAEQVADWARAAGLAPVLAVPVVVAGRSGGPEAAARQARYEVLHTAAGQCDAAAVLLGHTKHDQAETVLLALARGSGLRGLAGMPASRIRAGVAWLRPLLGIGRDVTAAACAGLGLAPWQDPQNTDPAYARARVRAMALPALVDALGDRVVDNLARTAALAAADETVLAELTAEALVTVTNHDGTLAVGGLRALPAAVRSRVLHAWVRQLGASGSALSHRHIVALEALVSDWHGQGPTWLPGGVSVVRAGDQLAASCP